MATYNHRNCKSLFGYASAAHLRSRGTCQLCDCGGPPLNFDLWRQLTIEHVIGRAQGGHLKSIRTAIATRFPKLSSDERETLSQRVDAANTVSACSFCNSTTSHTAAPTSLDELFQTPGTVETVVSRIEAEIQAVLRRKKADVQWKLASVKVAFEREVRPPIEKHGS
jgi:hypothetical protein